MAAVIFIDIVGYSLLPNQEQRELSQDINERCARFLVPEFRHQRLVRESTQALMVAAMPTGDGMVICLQSTPRPGLDIGHVLLLLAFYLTGWARQKQIALRIGLHSGDLAVIEDINGNSNFCGHAINQAQRIMDLGGGEGKHILCSTDFHQSYLSSKRLLKQLARHAGDYLISRGILSWLPKDNKSFEQYIQLSQNIDFEMTSKQIETDYIVKHRYKVKICNIHIVAKVPVRDADGKTGFETVLLAGTEERPSFKVTHDILDPKAAESDGSMLNFLFDAECRRIVVIGSINIRFANHLSAAIERGESERLSKIKTVDVYFCTDDNLKQMRPLQDINQAHTKISHIPHSFNNRCMETLKVESIKRFQELQPLLGVELNMFEYPFLPCAGVIAGYKETDSPDPSIIQVNRYVWGQKSLWSSIQVLRRTDIESDIDEYSKFKRYIQFTQYNGERIGDSVASNLGEQLSPAANKTVEPTQGVEVTPDFGDDN